jgi:hypothetical protein
MFRGEPMGFKHLQIVIKEAKKFNAYLSEVHGGFTADEIKRDDRER